jgi:hypothetical protein
MYNRSTVSANSALLPAFSEPFFGFAEKL